MGKNLKEASKLVNKKVKKTSVEIRNKVIDIIEDSCNEIINEEVNKIKSENPSVNITVDDEKFQKDIKILKNKN